jgi:hypothetical protein
MILSQKIFRLMHKVALFAILFASFAPTISHALVAHGSTNSFLQEVCSASGQKIFIEVVTSQGNLLQAGLDTKPDSQPISIHYHMDHCPFCHAGVADVAILTPHLEIIALLEAIAQLSTHYITPVVSLNAYISPPGQAPPIL